jgi:hypothetical protein
MSSKAICNPTTPTAAATRSARLADRLERGARELAIFAHALTNDDWRRRTPGDGRPVGVIVHHVASVYPLEIRLAHMIVAGTRIVGVTWDTVREMNAAHAEEHADASKLDALALLAENSAAAACAVRSLSDDDLDCAVRISLYGDAELTCQFMLEDHAVRHSYHHLARLRAALAQAARV